MNPYEETRLAALDGIKRSADGAAAWRPFMLLCIRNVAARLPYLTQVEVREEAGKYISLKPAPFNLMAFGGAIRQAMKEGTIRKQQDTERPSKTKSQHRARIVYQSMIYAPGAVITKSGVQPLLIDYGEMERARRVRVNYAE